MLWALNERFFDVLCLLEGEGLLNFQVRGRQESSPVHMSSLYQTRLAKR